MRGLQLSNHLVDVDARYLRDAYTTPEYRLWSIDDRHPAMIRTNGSDGVAVHVEVWRGPFEGIAAVLLREPPGLTIGKVRLGSGEEVLGVVGEPALVEGHREITEHGGWREYLAAEASARATAEAATAELS